MATPDFYGMLSSLGDTFQQNRLQNDRQRTLSELGQPGPDGKVDYSNMALGLLRAGDTQGAMSLAHLGQQQYLTSPAYIENIARTKAKVEQEFAPKTTNIKTQSGDEITVEKGPGGYSIPKIQGTDPNAGNPYAYGKQNENQAKDSGYANRMFRAEGVLRDPKVEAAATNLWENTKGMLPGFAANYVTSSDYQKFDQAKRDFVNAVLRRESGAAINQSEFDNAHKQYFPQPGDTKERIAEKRRNRQDAIAGVAGGGGQTYRPPFTFDQSGAMVPTANPRQGVKPAVPGGSKLPPGVTPESALAEAKAAIASGKDRNGVIQKLQSFGVDPSGL